MATVVPFPQHLKGPVMRRPGDEACQVVIFPGVRIERHEVDLCARVKDAAGSGEFDGLAFGGPAS